MRNRWSEGQASPAAQEILNQAYRFAYAFLKQGGQRAEFAHDLAQTFLEHLVRYDAKQFMSPNWAALRVFAWQVFPGALLRAKPVRRKHLDEVDWLGGICGTAQFLRVLDIRLTALDLIERSPGPTVTALLVLLLHPEGYWRWALEKHGRPVKVSRRRLAEYACVSPYKVAKALMWIRRNWV